MSDVAFIRAVPVVPARDFAAAAAFWRDKLGFAVAFDMGAYGGAERAGIMIHLDAGAPDAPPVSVRIDLTGVDALHTSIDPAVMHPDEPLETKPWGLRQFSVLDSTGNRITFAQESGARAAG